MRAVVLRMHKPPPRVVVDFHRPSATLLSLLGAFSRPRCGACRAVSPRRASRASRARAARFSPIAAKENPVVDALTAQTLPFLPDVGRELLGAALGALFLERAAALAFRRRGALKVKQTKTTKTKARKRSGSAACSRSSRARRGETERACARAAEPWSACGGSGRRRRENANETWADVVPPRAAESERIRFGFGSAKDGTTSGDGWRWPSIALPALPTLPNLPALTDVEVEWRSQTNPDNDSKVAFDPSVQRALRANLRRHRARNGNQKLYWPGAEMLAVEEGAATIAKPVDDVYRGDGDTDRAIGLGVSRMKRKWARRPRLRREARRDAIVAP